MNHAHFTLWYVDSGVTAALLQFYEVVATDHESDERVDHVGRLVDNLDIGNGYSE